MLEHRVISRFGHGILCVVQTIVHYLFIKIVRRSISLHVLDGYFQGFDEKSDFVPTLDLKNKDSAPVPQIMEPVLGTYFMAKFLYE